MKTVRLAIPMLLFLLSASVVGVEILSPLLTDGRVQSVIPARRLLDSWVISVISLAWFAYRLGKDDAALAAQGGRDE